MTTPPEQQRGGASKKDEVANYVRGLIAAPTASPGDKLPSENELAERFGVTRATVREGMRVLINSGFVESFRTKGYFIRDRRPLVWPMTKRDSIEATLTSAVDPWLTVIQREGYSGRQTIDVAIVEADKERVRGISLADQMEVGESGLLVVRDRVRYVTRPGETEEPQEIAKSFFTYDLVKDTDVVRDADIQPNVFDLLVPLGYVRNGFGDVIGARMPTQEEARKLWLGPGSPVLEVVRCSTFNDDRRVILLRHSVYHPNNLLSYEVGA